MRELEIAESIARDLAVERRARLDVRISEIAEERVEKVSDYFVEGEEVKVKVLEVDRQGKIRLTMKGIEG